MQGIDFEVKTEEMDDAYGKFVVSPLAQGYGHTLGNTLRRVLLSSLQGAAATKVKIKGVKHRFSTLKGLKEDVIELLFNVKEIRFKLDSTETVTVKLSKKGPGEVVAGDLELPAGADVVNKDLVLGTLADKKSKLEMEIEVEPGYGFRAFEEMDLEKIGVLPVDSVFSPIIRVRYRVEETRVGGVTNLDRLVLEIWTDGTVSPQKALDQAADISIGYFSRISSKDTTEIISGEEEKMEKEQTIEELGLSTRIQNILMQADITTIGELKDMTRKELMQVRNLGQKSVQEIKKALEEQDLELKQNE